MTLEEFAVVSQERIPTPKEFLDFVQVQGWRVALRDDGAAVLKADKTDPLACSLARLLSREPYRTNVLALAFPPEETPPPKTPPPTGRQWLWRFGQRYTETPDDAHLWGHPERHPVGAFWFRSPGETAWTAVIGRPGNLHDLPAEAAIPREAAT